MRKFSIKIWRDLNVWYNHYLSTGFIEKKVGGEWVGYCFEEEYPLVYLSRRFDKPAEKFKDGSCWWLDDKEHRIGKPACVCFDCIIYYENGASVK